MAGPHLLLFSFFSLRLLLSDFILLLLSLPFLSFFSNFLCLVFFLSSIRFVYEGAVDDNARSSDRSLYRRHSLSFPVVGHIERYCYRLDGQRLSMIHLAGDLLKIREICNGRMCDTAAGPWIMRSRHWVEAVQPIHYFISVRQTVRMSVDLKKLGTSDT